MAYARKTKQSHQFSINAKVARNINRSLVLNCIREGQPISRATISRITGLHKSTVSNIVTSLLKEELVSEDVDRNSGIGRNPMNLSIRKGRHYVGAMYIEPSKTEIAVVDIDGTLHARAELLTRPTEPKEFIARCVEELNRLRAMLPSHRYRGTGVTVAGIVDSSRTRVVYAPNLGWEHVDLGEAMQRRGGQMEPIVVENDAKASALAELLLGTHGVATTNLIFVSVGTGIGTGVVIDNRILTGNSHAAGEFGHMTIVEGGQLCTCGNRGCWEVYASDRATIERYRQAHGTENAGGVLTMQDVLMKAQNGDADAREALLLTGEYLGWGIANILRSFDPEVVILGGSIVRAWEWILPKIEESVRRHGFPGAIRSTTILPTSLPLNPPLLGAASLIIRRILADRRIAA